MATAQVTFAEVLWGATGSDVNHVNVRKYVLRKRNRRLRNIRPTGAFFTGCDKVTWPEEAVSGSDPDRKYVLRMPGFFPRLKKKSSSTVVTWLPDATKGHLTPSGFPCRGWSPKIGKKICFFGVKSWFFHTKYPGSVLGVFFTTSAVTGTSPAYLALLFSYNASLYVIINYPDRWRYYLVTW